MIDVSNLYQNRYGKKTDQNFSKIDITPLINSIISRASVRKFSKKNISKELLTLLLTAAQSAGLDSAAITWGLLGPTAALCRLGGAVVLALAAGMGRQTVFMRRIELITN